MSTELKENLERYIAHCQYLKDDDNPSGDGFTREFRELREAQVKRKEDNTFPADEGRKDFNIKKNRYKDILPYDYKRVQLDGDEESDYINASFIEDVNGDNGYIASQGPLPHTVNDFWRMLWQLKIEIVFMACREKEGDPPKTKCEKYWTEKGETKDFGEISVTTEEETLPMKDFYKRKICARCNGETHHVIQYHYIGWPDHGIPDHPSIINIMIKHMRTARQKPDIPLVIHCSAGCGRTGTICAIDYAWTLLNQQRIEKDFSVYDIISKFREQRQSMVQTPDQYELVYLVMENLFQECIKKYGQNNLLDTESLYGNADMDNGYENVEIEDVYVNTGPEQTGIADDNIYTYCEEAAVVIPKPVTTNKFSTNEIPQENKKSARMDYENVIQEKSKSSSSSEETQSSMIDNLYSFVDSTNNKKEIKKPVASSQPIKGNESPYLPPRIYTHEEITKPDPINARQPLSIPTQTVIKSKPESTHAISTGGGSLSKNSGIVHMVAPPVGRQPFSPNQTQHIRYDAQWPMAGPHRTMINVQRPAVQQIKYKVGGKELIVTQPVQHQTKPTQMIQNIPGRGPVDRSYHGQVIGYPVRVRRPSGGSNPKTFVLQTPQHRFYPRQ